MSSTTVFAIIFFSILIIGAWISSELVAHRHSNSNKLIRTKFAKLERENNALQQELQRKTSECIEMRSEFEKLKDAKSQIKGIEAEYKALYARYTNINRGIEILRNTIAGKRFIQSSLSKEIMKLLNEHLPDKSQIEKNKLESSHQAFKRIRDSMK